LTYAEFLSLPEEMIDAAQSVMDAERREMEKLNKERQAISGGGARRRRRK
jgi:hypothetical protein